MDKLKICWVASDNEGVGYYRSYLPCKYLSSHLKTSITVGFNPNLFPHYLNQDIIILQRHCDPRLLSFIDKMHKLGKQVWYDIDDSLWEIPLSNIAKRNFSKYMLNSINNIIKKCNTVTVSTQHLVEYLNRFNKSVFLLPNLAENQFKEKSNNDILKIIFHGSPTHSGDFSDACKNALLNIKNKYNVELYFMGYQPREFQNISIFVPFVPIDRYMNKLQSINPDISIMPLAKNPFNQKKSAIKYYESTISGAISIGSNTGPYEREIKDGITGFLCNNKYTDWYNTLEKCILDKGLREMVYHNACIDVNNNYTWNEEKSKLITDKYLEIYNNVNRKASF